jgi:hypothetical protein
MKSNVVVAAIDPGLLTGVCMVNFGFVPGARTYLVEAAELEFDDMLAWFDRVVPRADVIVSERFIIGPQTVGKSQAPWSLRVEGVQFAVCAKHGKEPVLQSPAEAKALVSNDLIRRLDLWYKGGAGHALDAVRHAVTWAMHNSWRDPRLLPDDTES